MPRTTLGAFYLDAITTETSTAEIRLINRDPEPNSPTTEVQGHPLDAALRLWVVATNSFLLSATGTNVYITVTPDGGSPGSETLIFTNNPTPTFSAGWTSSTYTAQMSSTAAAGDDEHVFKLVRDTDFSSLDGVQIRVEAATTTAETLDDSYSFTMEDLTVPLITDVSTRGLRTLRVTFDEPVLTSSTTVGGSLRHRDISGSVEFLPPDTIIAPAAAFTSADVGSFVGVAKSEKAPNNGYATILTVVDSETATIDKVVTQEDPNNQTLATLGAYKLVFQQDPLPTIEPGFTPIILSVAQSPATDFVVGTDLRQFVDITLQDDLSPERDYQLVISALEDIFENEDTGVTLSFQAEALPRASPIRFGLFDLIPELNKREDLSRDMERFVRSLDEVYRLIRSDIDRLLLIKDVDLVQSDLLDAILCHLGNPFAFTLLDEEKRRLINTLVEIYKRKGTEEGMEDVLNFLIPEALVADPLQGFDVEAFNDPGSTWVLGESELGIDTIVGPGSAFLLYSFKVISPIALTTEQRFRVTEIVEYMKPAHTHFVQLEEPTPAPLPTFPGWELGVSELGVDSELA